MMQEDYKKTNNYLFILYGVSDVAFRFQRYLQQQGKVVKAYFDRRAKELGDIGSIPVYELGTEPFLESQKSNCIVILCFQDALQHEQVVKQLHKNGYKKVLYLPMGSDGLKNNYTLLRNLFMDFSHGEVIEWNNIPEYEEKENTELKCESAVIRKSESYITFRCPYPLLFCGTPELNGEINRKLNNIDWVQKYANKNIICLDYYFELFEYLSLGIGSCNTYIKAHGANRNITEFISNRKQLLTQYAMEIARGSDFFDNSPIEVVWNKKGYFNIVDGHHRAAFLIIHEMYYLPVITRISDYDTYFQSNILKKINIDFVRTRINCPILHPSFFDVRNDNEPILFYYYRIIFQYFFNNRLNMDSILDASLYDMFFAREFKRMGCGFVAALNNVQNKNAIIFNKLLHSDDISLIDVEERKQVFDCIILSSELNFTKSKKNDIQWINQICNSTLILECDNSNAVSIILKNSDFQYREKIGQTFYNSRCHEVIVLKK